MKVSKSFKNVGFDVIQSYYYIDPESGNNREIDIIASYPEDTGCIHICFVIECKYSKEKPWLLFSSDTTVQNWNRLLLFSYNSISARKALISKQEYLIQNIPWMSKKGRVGYGVTQAFTCNEDKTFKAVNSVLKAAFSRKIDFEKESWQPFIFIFPIIVIDSLLFDCYLNEKDELQVQEINDSFIFFPMDIKNLLSPCIKIATSNVIDNIAKEAKDISNTLLSIFKNDIEQKLKEISI